MVETFIKTDSGIPKYVKKYVSISKHCFYTTVHNYPSKETLLLNVYGRS